MENSISGDSLRNTPIYLLLLSIPISESSLTMEVPPCKTYGNERLNFVLHYSGKGYMSFYCFCLCFGLYFSVLGSILIKHFNMSVFSTQFSDCMVIGRDLVRLMQYVARVPEVEKLWYDMLHNPTSLCSTFTGEWKVNLHHNTVKNIVAVRCIASVIWRQSLFCQVVMQYVYYWPCNWWVQID